MSKRADAPICPNRHCREDALDMIDAWDRKRFIEYNCKACATTWVVAKPLTE